MANVLGDLPKDASREQSKSRAACSAVIAALAGLVQSLLPADARPVQAPRHPAPACLFNMQQAVHESFYHPPAAGPVEV